MFYSPPFDSNGPICWVADRKSRLIRCVNDSKTRFILTGYSVLSKFGIRIHAHSLARLELLHNAESE